MDPNGKNLTQLTQGEGQEFEPVWSPDGEKIAFASDSTTGSLDILIMDSDGQTIEPTGLKGTPTDWIFKSDS